MPETDISKEITEPIASETTAFESEIPEEYTVEISSSVFSESTVYSESESVTEEITELSESTDIESEYYENSIPETEIDTDISEEIIENEILSDSDTSIETVIETLPSEETSAKIETTVIQETEEKVEQEFDYTTLIQPALYIICLIAGAILIYFYIKKSKSKNTGARQKENERKKQESEEKKAKKEKEKNDKTRKRKILPKTVKDTLPYKKCLDNDMWLLDDKKYSKVYEISDINYNLGDENSQEAILEGYCEFLDTLDDTVVCQMSLVNNAIDVNEQKKNIIIPEANDNYNKFRHEYNERVLIANLSKGNNAIEKKIYITLTIEATDEEIARRKFNSLDLTIKNSFDHIGNTKLRVLTNNERLIALKDFYLGSEYKIPEFNKEDFDKEYEKSMIAPNYFEFKDEYFMYGNFYGKVVFIKEYPNNAADNVLTDLMATNLKIICTTTVFALDPPKARKLVQRQIGAITGDMGQREAKAAKSGYFSQQMPIKIKNTLDSYKELFDMITIGDEKLFAANTLIMVQTSTHEELSAAMELIRSSLKRNGCDYSEMKWQQEDGLNDCLPVGSLRRFQWDRRLPTESVGIFQPFNVKEVHQPNSIYYGLNKLNNNMITFNRIKSLINPAGFILGCPGAGKSFSAKREMNEVYMRYPNADIIIIDPEREYPAITNMFDGQTVKISTSSKNYINPFDFDLSLLNASDEEEESYDVVKEKSQLITSFIACMYTNRSLTPQEVSFIDRCVRITYQQSHFLETLDKKDMPVLEDMFNVMSKETENVDPNMKRDMLATLEMYVGEGSANYFNNQTNVDVYNRLVSYDIKDLSGVLKTQAMLLVLDNVWNRLSANRDKGVPTWIYCDEIHVLFSNDYCLDFFRGLYKRARKYGGVLTGITQNVTDLLRDEACCTMLSNSEYLYLLKQSPSDALKLQEVLHFTDSELFYVTNVGAGEGLMVLAGGDKIPFYDRFPRDTEMYRAMSTNFSETQSMMKNKE